MNKTPRNVKIVKSSQLDASPQPPANEHERDKRPGRYSIQGSFIELPDRLEVDSTNVRHIGLNE